MGKTENIKWYSQISTNVLHSILNKFCFSDQNLKIPKRNIKDGQARGRGPNFLSKLDFVDQSN